MTGNWRIVRAPSPLSPRTDGMAGVREFRGCSFFEAMEATYRGSFFPETAPHLLEQCYCSHFPGTDDGAALGPFRDGVVELTVRKFQSFLAIGEMRAALLRLPSNVLAVILEADDLLVAK